VGVSGQPEARVALLIRITPDLHRRIKVAARVRGRSMSELVQGAIRRDLDATPLGPTIADRIREAR
jgi:predicted HicB family RNase H-like nuclease